MIKIKGNKGITLVSLVVAIIILLILSGITIRNFRLSNEKSYYNKMISDINQLNDKIVVYYNKYEEIPIVKNSNQIIEDKVYYKIDLTQLQNLTLNYGTEKDGDNLDIYLVNDNLEIYYLKGVENLKTIHHTITD